MRNWFPFSDYDFYAYITSGFALMFAIDFLFNGGTIMLRPSWPVVQIVLAFALAYVLGQVRVIARSGVLTSGSSGDQVDVSYLNTVFELYSSYHLSQIIEAA